MLDIKLVSNGDDWEGVYLNDQLICQASTVSVGSLLSVLKAGRVIDVSSLECDKDWLDGEGLLPDSFDDVVIKGES